MNSEQLITTREAAEVLRKHEQVLADWRHMGRGPRYIRFGRSIRYRVSDLLAYIDENTVTPSHE